MDLIINCERTYVVICLVYLEDKAIKLDIYGKSLSIYGTPWTAIYGKPGKAFQISPDGLADKWQQIPRNTDILGMGTSIYNLVLFFISIETLLYYFYFFLQHCEETSKAL